jgi:hypothetical protein
VTTQKKVAKPSGEKFIELVYSEISVTLPEIIVAEMKMLLVLLIVVSSISRVEAQYRTYKHKYDLKAYKHEKSDRYNPAGAAILAIIPGLGHCYVGEPLRGLGFVGLIYGSLIVTTAGVAQAYNRGDKNSTGLLIFGGAAGMLGSYIWSIADVSRIAKIKNLAFRDKKISFHLQPTFQQFANEYTKTSNLIGVNIITNF